VLQIRPDAGIKKHIGRAASPGPMAPGQPLSETEFLDRADRREGSPRRFHLMRPLLLSKSANLRYQRRYLFVG
jgi:hypothetical protein